MILKFPQEFYQIWLRKTPLLAIDYGQRKIGTAIYHPATNIPMPHLIINYNNAEDCVQQLQQIILTQQIGGIVVGLPLNMDGSSSPQTDRVRSFAQNLVKHCQLPIFLQDERLSSKLANQFLTEFGLKRLKRHAIDDLAAANIILETFLHRLQKISSGGPF